MRCLVVTAQEVFHDAIVTGSNRLKANTAIASSTINRRSGAPDLSKAVIFIYE